LREAQQILRFAQSLFDHFIFSFYLIFSLISDRPLQIFEEFDRAEQFLESFFTNVWGDLEGVCHLKEIKTKCETIVKTKNEQSKSMDLIPANFIEDFNAFGNFRRFLVTI